MGIMPAYQIIANDQDVTAVIQERFIDMTIVDRSGLFSDALTLRLADNDPTNPIQLPPTGAELRVSLGYDSNVTHVGMYVVDRIELHGWPQIMTIHGHAAVWDATPAGKKDLQSQKNRTWTAGTTLGHLVDVIASEHGMQPVVDSGLTSITLPTIAQQDESDLHLLIRIARMYDAIAKPVAGRIILAQRGSGKAANGSPLPRVTVDASECSKFSLNEQRKITAGSVVASYHDVAGGKKHEVTAGKGAPVKRLKMYYPNQATALAAAKAELERRAREKTTLRLTTALGRADAFAEAPMTVTSFGPVVPGDWIITGATHRVGRVGFTTEIEAEAPNVTSAISATDTVG